MPIANNHLSYEYNPARKPPYHHHWRHASSRYCYLYHQSRRGVRRRPVEPRARPSARGRRKEKVQGSSLPTLPYAANRSRIYPIRRLPDHPGWTVFDLPSTPDCITVHRRRPPTDMVGAAASFLLPSTSSSPILRRTCCWMSARGARSSACWASELGRLSPPPPTTPCRPACAQPPSHLGEGLCQINRGWAERHHASPVMSHESSCASEGLLRMNQSAWAPWRASALWCAANRSLNLCPDRTCLWERVVPTCRYVGQNWKREIDAYESDCWKIFRWSMLF